MAEVPEHLLKRSQERRKALGLPVEGEDDGDRGGRRRGRGRAAPTTRRGRAAAGAAGGGADAGDAITETTAAFPRTCSSARAGARPRSRGDGGDGGRGRGRGCAAAPRPRRAAAVARADRDRPRWSHPAPADGRQVGLDPADARRGAGQGARLAAPARRSSSRRSSSLTAFVTIFSALVQAPLLGLADVNQTPNPSKAPWYFLGLQELLTMFHPMVAGVTIPGVALGLLAIAPLHRQEPVEQAEGPQVRDLDVHDLHDVVGGARHHRFVLPGPGLQLRVPLERRHLLRAVGAEHSC